MKKASLLGLFFLLMYPVTAHASSNCGGNNCTLPSVFPSIPEPETPVTTNIKNIIINGMFDENATDPSNGDESFIYYFEHLDKTTETSFVPSGNVNTNRSCTNCDSVSISSSRQVGWTNSASLGISTALTLGAPPAMFTLGSSLSQTFGYNQAFTRTITKDFTLNCCSRTRFLDEIVTETDRFIIGWQEDVIGGWIDKGKMIYSVTKTDFGLTEITLDGECIYEPPVRDERDLFSHWSGDQSNDAQISFDNESQTLSFGNMTVTPTLKLNDGSDSIADPLEGATITIGTSTLLDVDIEQGWFLSNSTIEYLVGDVPVLTADLVNGFLFREGGEPQFDSELQYDLANISVNNFIDSPYLDGLQTYTENGNSSFLSFNSNILDLSNNLTISAISTGEISVDGKKVPEPSSTTTIFALGTLGAASTLKRKLKPSKSAEKKLEKVS